MWENFRPGRPQLTVRRGDRLADEAGMEAGHAVAALPAGVVRRDLPDTGPVVGGAAGPAAPDHVALLLAHLIMIVMMTMI